MGSTYKLEITLLCLATVIFVTFVYDLYLEKINYNHQKTQEKLVTEVEAGSHLNNSAAQLPSKGPDQAAKRSDPMSDIFLKLRIHGIFAKRKITNSTNNIFFIETTCINETLNLAPRELLKPRQACGVYSTAYHNPFKNVFLLATCPLPHDLYVTSSAYVRALLDLPNFSVAQVNLKEIYEGSSFAEIDLQIKWKSDYPVEHSADLFRILILYLYGGTYLDLDIISMRALDDLGINYVGAENVDLVGTAVINFNYHHPFLKAYLSQVLEAYNPSSWTSIGPQLASSVLLKFCNLKNSTTNFTSVGYIPQCAITVWNDEVFYPLKWKEWHEYWNSSSWPKVQTRLKNTYVVHIWNHMSNNSQIEKGSGQPYEILAQENCGPVHSAAVPAF